MRPLPFLVIGTLVAGTVAALSGSPATAAVNRYEAETAPAVCTGTIDANHAGFSGTGFCNGDNAVGAAVQFTVTMPAAGRATLGVRLRQRHHHRPPGGRPRQRHPGLDRRLRRHRCLDHLVGQHAHRVAGLPEATPSGSARPRRPACPTSTNLDVDSLRQLGSAGTGRPDDSNIQYYGRWSRSDPAFPAMGWAGGYLETRFTGSVIGVRQRNAIDLYYSIDRPHRSGGATCPATSPSPPG